MDYADAIIKEGSALLEAVEIGHPAAIASDVGTLVAIVGMNREANR